MTDITSAGVGRNGRNHDFGARVDFKTGFEKSADLRGKCVLFGRNELYACLSMGLTPRSNASNLVHPFSILMAR